MISKIMSSEECFTCLICNKEYGIESFRYSFKYYNMPFCNNCVFDINLKIYEDKRRDCI